MDLLANSKGEKLSQESFNYLLESKETIDISFVDGKRMKFPKFLFFFFSDLVQDQDIDNIVLPITFQEHTFENIIEFLVNPKDLNSNPFKEVLKFLGFLAKENLKQSNIDPNWEKSNKNEDSDHDDADQDSHIIVKREINDKRHLKNKKRRRKNFNKLEEKKEITLSVKLENDLDEDDCDISVSDIEEFHSMLERDKSTASFDLKTEKKKSLSDNSLKLLDESSEIINDHSQEKLPSKKKKLTSFLEEYGSPHIEFGEKNRSSFANITKITCLICNKIFERVNYNPSRTVDKDYKEHYKRHEAEARSCGCNQEFRSTAEKSFHLSTFHDGLYGCPKCRILFKTVEKLQKHMSVHERVYSCSQCDFRTTASNKAPASAKYQVKMHEQTHRVEEQQQVYVCKICEEDGFTKHFSMPCKLKIHMDRVHSPKSCPLCGVTVKMLDLHMANIHRSDEEKQYKCSDCGKGFDLKYKLETHSRSQHSGMLLTCRYPDCERVYKDVSNRSAHEKKSHGRVFGRQHDERKVLETFNFGT